MCCRFYVDDDLPEEAAGELGIDFLPGKNWKKVFCHSDDGSECLHAGNSRPHAADGGKK